MDHVIAGTGFEPDVDRISFLEPELARQVSRVERAPRLSRRFESSVEGLYFVGPVAAFNFGLLFRFVAGAAYAAPALADHLARTRRWVPALGRRLGPPCPSPATSLPGVERPGPNAPAVLVLAPARFTGPLGVARSLGRLGVRVHALARVEPSLVLASRHCAGRVSAGWNGHPEGAADEEIVDQLLIAGGRLGHRPSLLAASDPWAVLVAAQAQRLQEVFRFPKVPLGLRLQGFHLVAQVVEAAAALQEPVTGDSSPAGSTSSTDAGQHRSTGS